jgi:hypothetical protein
MGRSIDNVLASSRTVAAPPGIEPGKKTGTDHYFTIGFVDNRNDAAVGMHINSVHHLCLPLAKSASMIAGSAFGSAASLVAKAD